MQILPSRGDTEQIVALAPDWWGAVDIILPPLSIRGKADLLAGYERLSPASSSSSLSIAGGIPRSQPGATDVAIWLLNMAMTVHNLPSGRKDTRFEDPNRLQAFPNLVSQTVEARILANDELASTISGLECALLLVRLRLNLGRARNAWLCLRRAISVAETVSLARCVGGLDRQSESKPRRQPVEEQDMASSRLGASIWLGLSFIDKFLSTLVNLPTITYGRVPTLPACLTRGYPARATFWSLSEIAGGIAMRDQLADVQVGRAGSGEQTAALARKLQELRDAYADEEWLMPYTGTQPSMVCRPVPILAQYCFYYLQFCCYLPTMLRTKEGGPGASRESRDICLASCRALAERYILPSKAPASDFLAIRMIDFVAFTAAVMLALYSVSGVSGLCRSIPNSRQKFTGSPRADNVQPQPHRPDVTGPNPTTPTLSLIHI